MDTNLSQLTSDGDVATWPFSWAQSVGKTDDP